MTTAGRKFVILDFLGTSAEHGGPRLRTHSAGATWPKEGESVIIAEL
jgi:hypothetical protein